MLVGKKIKATKSTPLLPANIRGVATYVDAAGVLTFVAVSDVAFVASTGAALAMFPLGPVTEAIKSGKPDAVLVENAYEVLNVASSLFNEVEGTTVHVKVQKLVIGPLAPELLKRIAKPTSRLDMDIAIPGYPNGKLSFIAVAAT